MGKIPKKAKIRTINRMVRVIDEQLQGKPAEEGDEAASYILDDFTDQQLKDVRSFLNSFIPAVLREEEERARAES